MKQSIHLPALLCALAAPASAQLAFGPAANIPTGNEPEASALGDFNGDGFNDLAVTSDAPDRVEIRFGNGTGAFGAASSVATGNGTGPHTPVTGDLDGDGDVDIAVSLHNVNQVRVLTNNGAGGFSLGAVVGVGIEPRSMAIGDLDGDGDLDLVTSNRDGNTVSVLLNTGAGFSATSYAAGQEPREIGIAELTGDTLPDIAVAAHDSRQVIVLRNTGGGAFVNGATLSVGSQFRPQGLATGDLNGDGRADIAITNEFNPGVEFVGVFLNQGGTVFSGPTNYALNGADASSLDLGDLDLDGDLDVLTANTDSSNANVLANNGSGAFGAAQVLGAGVEPGHALIGQVDANASPDLLITNSGSNSVTRYLNLATGGFVTYCTPGTSASGCQARIDASGTPSASAASGFLLLATDVEGQKDGLFFFGTNGRQANAWGNGTSFQCVVPPLSRAGVLPGSGTNGACDGSFAQDLNARWTAKPSQNPGAGALVQAQLWYRDPQNTSNQTTSLSDAIEFTVAP